MRKLILMMCLVFGAAFAASCESQPGTNYHSTLGDKRALIYIVRHAEKQVASGEMMLKDPHLTAAGEARAARLAAYLSAEKVDEVWSTDYARTRETAAPVAEANGLEVQLYEPGHSYRMADRLREKEGVMLIVGHSNTIGAIAGAFIHEDPQPDLDESDYETLYWVTIDMDGTPQLYQSSYEGLERRVSN